MVNPRLINNKKAWKENKMLIEFKCFDESK